MQDLTAIQTANLLNINRDTINRYYRIFREKILAVCEEENGIEGALELDESLEGNIIMAKGGAELKNLKECEFRFNHRIQNFV